MSVGHDQKYEDATNEESKTIYDDTAITQPSHLILLASFPCFLIGKWWLGFVFVITGLTLMFVKAINDVKSSGESNNYNDELADWYYESLEPHEILDEMKLYLDKIEADAPESERVLFSSERHLPLLSCLRELMLRYAKATKNSSEHHKSKSEQFTNSSLALLCQEAAYLVLQPCFLNNDDVVAAAFSLLALVAKDPCVCERHMFEADSYGIDKPVLFMNTALQRAIDAANAEQNTDEQTEQIRAELQRKGCLLLGALADGDSNLATQIVSEGGLESILKAVDWYRYHELVANWALWAIFSICYENEGNKLVLIQLDGLRIIIQTMRNCSDNLELTRHGVAILFDLIRNNNNGTEFNHGCDERKLDTVMVRNLALALGLNEVIFEAVTKFHDASTEVFSLGQELLRGSKYENRLPVP